MLPRFALKDLFFATTLIAVGIGGFLVAYAMPRPRDDLFVIFMPSQWAEQAAPFVVTWASTAAIGAGMGALYQHKVVGALAGLGLIALLTLALICLHDFFPSELRRFFFEPRLVG